MAVKNLRENVSMSKCYPLQQRCKSYFSKLPGKYGGLGLIDTLVILGIMLSNVTWPIVKE